MKTILTELPGVVIIEPQASSDKRGWFIESYNKKRYHDIGITEDFLQDNISNSASGTLRGLHFQQVPYMQGKLVGVMHGEVFDVVVDIRIGSPTFGKWISVILNSDNRRQLYIPPGFAHGFSALYDNTVFYYKCTQFYVPGSEVSIAWNDPTLKISWPVSHPSLSEKDQLAPQLANYSQEFLPKFSL